MTLNELLQDFVNEPYENLVGMAHQSIVDILPVFNEIADDGQGSKLIIAFIGTSLAIDGKLSELEYRFVCDVLGGQFSYDEVKNLASTHYSGDMINAIDGLVDSAPVELKSALITFCCCFLAVDETISREEVAFVAKLCQ